MNKNTLIISVLILFAGVSCNKTSQLNIDENLGYCDSQIRKTLSEIDGKNLLPRNIPDTAKVWNLEDTNIKNWTIGFFPGILWYNYENKRSANDLKSAEYYTGLLKPITEVPAFDHDLGFQIMCSYGNAYRLTQNPDYKQIILNSAEKEAQFFNPKVGTILSWERHVADYGGHNTIIDNLINLEMLFWAAKNGGSHRYYEIAVQHADTTMKYGFRDDGGCYHVAIYDTLDGHFLRGVTHQGYADSSLWARGQSWAIYGYTMIYRETNEKRFLRFAEKVTDLYLSRLPKNEFVPYWDFDAPDIPNEPRDASAAAVTASALIELSQLEDDAQKAETYLKAAMNMLSELSSEKYQSRDKNPAFLMHSTGHHPNGSEIDASIIYADYYYIEALTRAKSYFARIKK